MLHASQNKISQAKKGSTFSSRITTQSSHSLLSTVSTKNASSQYLLSLERALLCETGKVAIKINGRKKAKVSISYLVHIWNKAVLEQPNQEGAEEKASKKRKEGMHKKKFKSKNLQMYV